MKLRLIESFKEDEYEELEYNDLEVEYEYGNRSNEDNTYDKTFKSNSINYTLKVPIEDIKEELVDIIYQADKDNDLPEDEANVILYKMVDENYENLLQIYIEDIQKAFRYRAQNEVEEIYDWHEGE